MRGADTPVRDDRSANLIGGGFAVMVSRFEGDGLSALHARVFPERWL